MRRRLGIVLVAGVVSFAALLVGYFGLRRSPAVPAASITRAVAPGPTARTVQAEPAAVVTARAVAASPASSTSSPPAPVSEAALMSKLRELRSSDPDLTLRLARQGNERFANSADAAERAWFVVKALSDLGRHDEARAEGRALLERYRGSRWAEDVYRHLFVNPPTHPSERGYGKQLESDP